MTDSSIGILILLLIAVISAILWHRFVKIFPVAVIGATVSTVVLFQCVAFAQLGYLDPLFLVAVATSSLVASTIAIVVGLPFRTRRRQNARQRGAL